MDQISSQNNFSSSSGTQPGQTKEPIPKGLLIAEADENTEIRKVVQEALLKQPAPNDLQAHIDAVKSKDRKQMHIGVIALRKALSTETNPPIQNVIDSGIVPLLKDFLMNDDEPHLQLEAAWALTNIASGTAEQTKVVADHRGIELFISLLKSKRLEIAEQAIWAVGNLAGESREYRNKILGLKGLEALVELSTKVKEKDSYCHLVANAFSVLAEGLASTKSIEVIADSVWALSAILDSEGCEEQGGYTKAIELSLIPVLVKLLAHPKMSVSVPCMRCIGTLASGDSNIYIDEILKQPDFFEIILSKLVDSKKAIRKETLWMLSNIAAGTPAQARQLVNHPSLIEVILNLDKESQPDEIVHEMIYVIGNLNSSSSFEAILELIKRGQLQFWTEMLSRNLPARSIHPALEGIQSLIDKSKAQGPATEKEIKSKLEESGLIELLKKYFMPEDEKPKNTSKKDNRDKSAEEILRKVEDGQGGERAKTDEKERVKGDENAEEIEGKEEEDSYDTENVNGEEDNDDDNDEENEDDEKYAPMKDPMVQARIQRILKACL